VSSFPRRLLRAALLDAEIYEEVEADRSSIAQAFVVVVGAGVAISLGRWLQATLAGVGIEQRLFQLAVSFLEPMVLWFGGSAFAFMVGASFFRGPETETDFPEVLRTTGFAFTPAALSAFAFLPPPSLGMSIDFFAWAWVLVAGIIAVRQALDFTTIRAIGTFGATTVLLWMLLWGLAKAPALPF